MKCIYCLHHVKEMDRIVTVQVIEYSMKSKMSFPVSRVLYYHVECYESLAGEEHLPPFDEEKTHQQLDIPF